MKPNCRQCKHFYITFDQSMPYGCRKNQIKSKQLPSQVVKAANFGNECVAYEAKKNINKEKNLNDSKYW